ncbi:MAG: hypothetical protein MZU97_26655 [Bacillus subtilis]|nr:hypothetical protein [Bacillus subtilis]
MLDYQGLRNVRHGNEPPLESLRRHHRRRRKRSCGRLLEHSAATTRSCSFRAAAPSSSRWCR